MTPSNWRLVCHTCDYRFPVNSALNLKRVTCCFKPELHVHDTDKGCPRCVDAFEAIGSLARALFADMV